MMQKLIFICVIGCSIAGLELKAQEAKSPEVITSVWAPPTEVTSKPGPRDLPIIIANDQLQLGFKSAEQGFGLGSMIFRANGREALSQVDAKTLWWTVEIRQPDAKIVTVTNLTAPPGKMVSQADPSEGADFVWTDIPVPQDGGTIDVTASVRLVKGSSFARMRIKVANHLKQAGLWEVEYPSLNHLGYPNESDCAVPTTFSMMNQGELQRRAHGPLSCYYLGKSVSEYPSGSVPIQHLSCSIGDNTVIYIGFEDGHANQKGYRWTMEEGLFFYLTPPDATKPGVDYVQDWDYVIGPMHGDWFDAAGVYRAWATKQFWCAKGPLEKRTDMPRSFFEVPYWADAVWPPAGDLAQDIPANQKASELPTMWRPGDNKFDPNALAYDVHSKEMKYRVAKAIKTLGLPLGVQWYGWHHCRFDGNYPDYFPPRPGFADYLKTLVQPGLFVHGFINGLWFDRALPEFKEKAAPNAILQADDLNQVATGAVDPLKFSKGTALMCPATEYWQKRMAGIAKQMADLGFKGAYMDVFGNAGNLQDFDPKHGHPLGGGHWFTDAQRKLADGMKGDGKLQYLATESFNEALGQSIDLFYTWNDWRTSNAPLLGSIYGGYLQWYGSRAFKKIHDNTEDDDVSFLTKITRAVFWGGHLEFYSIWDMAKTEEWVQKQVAQLIGLKRAAHKYLTYGQMVRPPQSLQPIPLIDAPAWNRGSRDNPPPLRIDSIERAAWRASDGTVALFLMNYDLKPVQVTFDLTTMPGLQPFSEVHSILGTKSSETAIKMMGNQLTVELPSRKPLMIEVGKSP